MAPEWVKSRTTLGQAWANCGPGVVQVLEQSASSLDHAWCKAWIKFGSRSCPALIKYGSIVGQVLVKYGSTVLKVRFTCASSTCPLVSTGGEKRVNCGSRVDHGWLKHRLIMG